MAENQWQRKQSNNARELALQMINEVLEEGKLSHIVMKRHLDGMNDTEENRKNKAFMTRLVLGTIEKKLTLDYVINCYSKIRTEKMKPVIRGILRMSVYQILFMESVPDSASCNEAVKLAKAHKFTSLAPFVNGVLRTIGREKENIRYPDENMDFYGALEVLYSVPKWMIELLERENGRENMRKMLSSLEDRQQKISFRINTSKASMAEVMKRIAQEASDLRVQEISLARDMISISGVGELNRLSALREGYMQVQDISSALVAQISGVKKGNFCMDLCAAPGGKTIHLADLMEGTGRVLARDITGEKTALIEENVKRCGFHNIITEVWDATIMDETSIGKADVVLVDAPCSGLGVIGHKADIRYRLKQEDIKELAEISKKILACAVKYLKPGGILIFSTCTMTKTENDDNRQWLLENFNLEPADITPYLSEELLAIGDNRETAKDGYLKLMLSDQYDGFYISKMYMK